MSPPTNYIYLATRNLRLLSLVILRRRRNLTPVNPLNPRSKFEFSFVEKPTVYQVQCGQLFDIPLL